MKESYTTNRFYREFLYPQLPVAAFLSLLSVIVTLGGLVMPWGLKIIIDDCIPQGNMRTVALMCGVLLAILAGKFLVEFFRDLISYRTVETIIRQVRERAHGHLITIPFRESMRWTTGECISRLVSDTDALNRFLVTALSDFFTAVVMVVSILCIMAYISPKLTVIACLFFPFFIIFYRLYSGRLKGNAKNVREFMAHITNSITESFQGIRVIKGYGLYEKVRSRFHTVVSDYMNAAVQMYRTRTVLWLTAELIAYSGILLLLYFSVQNIFAGTMSAGGLVAFYTYISMLFTPVVHIISISNEYHEAAASIDRLCELFSIMPEKEEQRHPAAAVPFTEEIRFDRVSFCYTEGVPVLTDISFRIRKGETVAFVGPSGAGKTTIVNLLLRFYLPAAGMITMDGVPLSSRPLEAYRQLFAMVLQDDYLFSGTIRENLCYGVSGVTDERMVAAARAAYAHSFISRLPDGYETPLGERGITLSGGERQRLSIARALLRDRAVVVFDEATAAVDAEVDVLIQNALKEILRGRTSIIIAHRLSTVQYADRIIVLDRGSVQGEGNHAELLRKNALYQRLYEGQRV